MNTAAPVRRVHVADAEARAEPAVHPANNFDAMRLLAAGMVVCSHQFALSGRAEPRILGLMTLGTLGVLVFFSVSGYLVAQSWDRDPHAWRFVLKRWLRIWPGLALVTCITALLFGPLMTQLPLHDYVRSPVTWDYFSQLYFGVPLHLPGVFEDNPIPVVNGSLWTIPIEVRWYGILLLAGLCGLLREHRRFLVLALVVFYAIYRYFIYDVQHNPASSFLGPDFGCEYGTFFCYGAVMFHFRHEAQRYSGRLGAGLLALAAVLAAGHHSYAALYVLLPFAVIHAGRLSTPVLRRFGRYGDFSYGIYIYAFLIQQWSVGRIGPHQPYAFGLLVSTAGTLVCALLSWHLVERPALNLKRLMARGPVSSDRNAVREVDLSFDDLAEVPAKSA